MARLFLAFAVALCALAAQAQGWPSKPVRLIVPYPPGGSTDVTARTLAERIAPALGQSVLVENRAGAGGNIGIEAAVKSDPDGYTVLVAPDFVASAPHVYKLNYDPMTQLVPVIQLTSQPVVLAVHPSLGVADLAGLVALAKQKPGLAYATSGAGSQQHIAAEWFAKLAGIQLTHVPYKGGGQAIADFLGGQVPIASLGSTPVIPHHKSGKVKILAQTTKKRAPSLPEVPTYEEAGMKGLVIDQWLGVFVPAGTDAQIVRRLNAEFDKALADPAVRERLAKAALEPVGGSTEAFAQLVRANFEMYRGLVADLKIRVN
ncbi:MAG: tripartite tricarboxylate transporter substrate binding protein [Betaproteobacteria bacterium]|nr:tripartite tricarboxylate transporter substrate binding protein [Betaproteobacteria bacterium]MDH5220720.1 tripartite tricarboxylate transporter substrate binding protein [Betaproteobacteria bacterium]MDH5350536.1 tripartite tricarboxylate transporter substrate binding protein [Betaproteobacteria bacterium]